MANGGVCGRRAFFGRYILRCFGVPTQKRPSRAHGALMFKTHPRDAKHWVVRLAPGWGGGSGSFYGRDRYFRLSAYARENPEFFLQVKRAQMVGILKGERLRQFGRNAKGAWYRVAYEKQKEIRKNGLKINGVGTIVSHPTLAKELGPEHPPTVAQKLMASPVPADARKVKYLSDGTIVIPAALGYNKKDKKNRGLSVMRSFLDGGLQLRMSPYSRGGASVMRGGSYKGGPDGVNSGKRFRSVQLANYPNFGMRVAMTPEMKDPPRELTLDLGHGVTMEMVYIKPGTFIMGGERTKQVSFHCVEVPKHEVILTKAFYIGKFEVTQSQYGVIMSLHPEKVNPENQMPKGRLRDNDAMMFCRKMTEVVGKEIQLPTEAEWEYACRAGTQTKWFFGDDPGPLEEYAWCKSNSGRRAHPVGQKKPNPWRLYDIYGNVWEYVYDQYDKDYFKESPKVDPTGPTDSGDEVGIYL